MGPSTAFRASLLWLLGSALMIFAALSTASGSYIDGQYLPSVPDAFYHGRRILDSVLTGEPVLQFDSHIHMPEGSWITWPWGYDQLLAGIVRLFGPFEDARDAARILMHVPVFATPIAVGLVVLITRQLGLSLLESALAVIGFAVLPGVYLNFAVGNIDHHYAELMWTLATLSAGISFFGEPRRPLVSGCVLGAVLGTAVAIHNGLFILQIPVAATFALLWLRGQPLPDARRIAAFSVSLLVATLLVCVPAETWRRGVFEFYTLSWFHTYIAACTAIFAFVVGRLTNTRRNVLLLVALCLGALVPIARSIGLASSFVSGALDSTQGIIEVYSPYRLYEIYGPIWSTEALSWLMWIALPMTLLNLWWAWSSPTRARQFAAVAAVGGLALLQMQSRFGVFGIAFLLITPVLLARDLSLLWPGRARAIALAVVAVLVVAFVPSSRSWSRPVILAGHPGFSTVRTVFPVLHDLCAKHPGVVVADANAGHWVRYFSDCSTIADVFLLTAQHARHAQTNARILGLTPEQLLASDVPARYVFAQHMATMTRTGDPQRPEVPVLAELTPMLLPLERTLLTPGAQLPPRFVLRWEGRTPGGQLYARLFEIAEL